MKIGDLVKCRDQRPGWQGIIIETGVYVGRKDTKVLWNNGDIWVEQSKHLEVINESR